MMNKDIAIKWVDALRSGYYEQCDGTLLEVDEGVANHCALGVLCDLAIQRCVIEEDAIVGQTTVPHDVCMWAGLEDDQGPTVVYEGKRLSIVNLNDGWCPKEYEHHPGLSFDEIADIIEEQVINNESEASNGYTKQ